MSTRDFLCIFGVACIAAVAGADWQANAALGRFSAEFAMSPSGDKRTGRVEIRIRNSSDMDFDRVRAHFPDQQEVDYGPVAKGGVTEYRTTGRAYRYAGFSVKADDREFSMQPIDYMGETELPAGRYTYVLDVDDGQLMVRLEEAE
jgi:hypothetical protein